MKTSKRLRASLVYFLLSMGMVGPAFSISFIWTEYLFADTNSHFFLHVFIFIPLKLAEKIDFFSV